MYSAVAVAVVKLAGCQTSGGGELVGLANQLGWQTSWQSIWGISKLVGCQSSGVVKPAPLQHGIE